MNYYIHYENINYISFNEKKFFEFIKKCSLIQTSKKTYKVLNLKKEKMSYKNIQSSLRNFALDWQLNFNKFDYDWSDLYFYGYFFKTYGRRYGLIKEFRENAII